MPPQVLGEGATMALVGLVVGGLAAIPLSRLRNGPLFGVVPVDPPTIGLAAVLLVVVASSPHGFPRAATWRTIR